MTETAVLERGAAKRIHDEIDDRYYLYPPTGELFPSFSTIAGATWYKPWIAPWMTRVTTNCCLNNIETVTQLLAAGKREEAFDLINQESHRIWELKANAGTYVHDVGEACIRRGSRPANQRHSIPIPELPDHLVGLLYDDEPIELVTQAMINGFHQFCRIWKPVFRASEMPVYHPLLKYAGTLDIILTIPNARIVKSKITGKYILIYAEGQSVRLCVDIKTGKEPGSLVWEQLAAYRRCLVCDVGLGQLRKMLITDAGAVLHLRPEFENGFQLILVANEHDARGWNTFQDALRIFHERKSRPPKVGSVLQFPPKDGSEPLPLMEDLGKEGYRHVPGALRKAGIKNIKQLSELDEAGCLALKGIGPKSLSVIRIMLSNHGLHLKGEAPETAKGAAA